MENQRIQISRDYLDKGIVLGNHVLCRAYYDTEGLTTKSGVVIGFNNDVTYGSEDGKDTSSHIADMAPTSLIVYRTPRELYFDPEDSKSMEWETDMELREGDIVFTNPIDALNSLEFECEGEVYKLISYSDIYVTSRNKWDSSAGIMGDMDLVTTEPQTLNGYVLCAQVFKEKLSELDVTSEDKLDKTLGVVRYLGRPNKRYRLPEIYDFTDLKEGDTVKFDKKCTPFLLERTKYNSRFSEEPLWVVQRRQIAMVVKHG